MRPILPLAAALLALGGCSNQPESGAATANADVLADQLQAKANNYSMLADNATSCAAALALENASASLSERAGDVRTEAHPRQKMKAPGGPK